MGFLRRALRLSEPKPKLGEQTGSQETSYGLGVGYGIQQLTNPLPVGYSTYRTMRKHPTLALARALGIAAIVAGEWRVESDDDADEDRVKFIQDMFLPIREPFLAAALYGGCDFGWQPFEKVFAEHEGRIILKKLKPLCHDLTTILVDAATGAFKGFQQRSMDDLPLANCLLVSFRVEGTQWHGEALLENARVAYNQWVEAAAGAERYDKKLAGVQPVVKHPPGTSSVDGVEKSNAEAAADLLNGLQAGSGVTIAKVPLYGVSPDQFVEAWEFQLLSDPTTRQPGFRDRLDYLDKQMVRALLWPERAITEGIFGTKAEAGAHQGLAMVNADLLHRDVTRILNWHCVDQILALNFGEEARGTVRLEAAPLVNAQLEFIRQLYVELVKSPAGVELVDKVDMDGVMDMLGVPKSEEIVDEDESEIGARKGPSEPGMDVNNPLAVSVKDVYRNVTR